MKKYMLLHFGFEKPTPEIMARWNSWFEAVADKTVENGGFRAAREISHNGTRELPMNKDSITGYSIIEAEDIEEATTLAQGNPFIASIRIYEVMQH